MKNRIEIIQEGKTQPPLMDEHKLLSIKKKKFQVINWWGVIK